MIRALLICSIFVVPLSANAIEAHFAGYADARLMMPPDETSYLEGGLGKFRYGSMDNDIDLRWSEILGDASVRVTPGLSVVVIARIEPEQTKAFDFLEAYVKYRPVSTTPWRWNVKLGAFFPPISLENTEIGWTSPWTLTPSAINSWVGDELRIIGGSAGLEYRMLGGSISLEGGLFGWNDPAGVVLALRGWAMNDRPASLLDKPRMPDAIANDWFIPTPWNADIFEEVDGRPGWYVNGSFEQRGLGRIQVMRYDNEANLGALTPVSTWHTHFWSAGYSNHFGPVTLLAQAMTGATDWLPPPMRSRADFDAAYVLLGWQVDPEWRVAARIDGFEVTDGYGGAEYYPEHGHAFTLAANWQPKHWLRISGEALQIVSSRAFRNEVGLEEDTNETQVQLGARVYY